MKTLKELTRVKSVTVPMIARLYEKDGSSFLATIPVRVTSVPECPEAVVLGSAVYVLVTTNTLRYDRVTTGKAVRRK
jgi:hypothetical protein